MLSKRFVLWRQPLAHSTVFRLVSVSVAPWGQRKLCSHPGQLLTLLCPDRKCCDEKLITEGVASRCRNEATNNPPLYKQVISTTEKLLLSTALLRNLCFLYTPCWLLEFYLSCFLALNLFEFVKEKKQEGNQPGSLWFSLRIHPNFPSRHMSLTGPSNHQGGPRASESRSWKPPSPRTLYLNIG